MGTSLTGLTPATTYDALIKVGDNGPIDGTLKTLSDGLGNNLPMQASSTGINFTGTTSGLVSGVSGAIQFSNGSAFASDAANFFWDDTNNRLGIGTNAPSCKFMVFDNTAGDPTSLFEKDVLSSYSDIYAYNKNGSTNLTTGQLAGQVSFGGYFNSTYNPTNQEFSAVQGYYTGTGTTRRGGLRLSTHDGSNLQPAVIVNESQLVGIGQITPTARLHVLGTGSTSATTSLLVQNSAGTDAVTVLDNLNATLGGTVTSVGGFRSIAYFDSFQRVALNNGLNTNPQNYIISGGIGRILLVDNSEGDFNRLQFGGTSASFPSLKRASNNIEIKNADDTFGAGLSVGGVLDATAILQADSTTKGFLPPRMTNTQRAAIATPAEGLLLFNTTNKGVAYRDGTNWGYLSGAKQTVAASGGTVAVSFASGNIIDMTLTASTTLTLSAHVVGTYIFELIQGGSGSYTITWPASVKWSGGTAPTLTTTVGKTDIVTLFHDGTNFFGTYSLNY